MGIPGNLNHIHRPAEKNRQKLPELYKPVLYCIQNLHYLETGDFVLKHSELIEKVCKDDREVLKLLCTEIPKEGFLKTYETVFTWCQRAMPRTREDSSVDIS